MSPGRLEKTDRNQAWRWWLTMSDFARLKASPRQVATCMLVVAFPASDQKQPTWLLQIADDSQAMNEALATMPVCAKYAYTKFVHSKFLSEPLR